MLIARLLLSLPLCAAIGAAGPEALTPPPGGGSGSGGGGAAAPPDSPPQKQDEQPKGDVPAPDDASEEQVRVWALEAATVARRVGVSGEPAAKLADAYVEARKRIAADIAEARRQARERLDEQIRQTGGEGIEHNVFDNSELEYRMADIRSRERSRLATEMVAILERPVAEKAFPRLAGFDPRVDGMVRLIAAYELGDEKTFAAVDAVQTWYVDLNAAIRQLRENRSDPATRDAARAAMRKARENLFAALERHLAPDQVERMKRMLGVNPKGD
jgi:hypothetical protein